MDMMVFGTKGLEKVAKGFEAITSLETSILMLRFRRNGNISNQLLDSLMLI